MRSDPLIGLTVAGHRIEGLLGEGGMGIVYRARHERLGRVRALKLLPPQLARDRSFRERFEREWRLAASIEHPNIVDVIDAGQADDHLYIVMRLIEGIDLAKLIEQDGPLEPERALLLLEQAASALDAAHEQGLVHRDVTPRNILVGDGDHAYLADFGVARAVTTRGLTQKGFFVGNLDYAAPEQIEGRSVDRQVDVYALGGVLYTCLTARVPYERDEEVQVMYAHLRDPAPVPSASRPELAAGLDRVVATAMAKEPQERYASCGGLILALRSEVGAPAVPGETTLADASASESETAGGAMPATVLDGPAETVLDAPVETVLEEPSETALEPSLTTGHGDEAPAQTVLERSSETVLDQSSESVDRPATEAGQTVPAADGRSGTEIDAPDEALSEVPLSALREFPVGASVGGYKIGARIGRGGMGAVYLAERPRLGSKVALKILDSELAADERFRHRFVRESQMASSLDHPNIVPVYDAGEADGLFYIAMRYVDGPSLKQLLETEGRIAFPRALALLAQVGSALDSAHEHGLVHRDVKPANILVSRGGASEYGEHVYLTDFGVSKRLESHSGLTGTGQFIGTLSYVAPEQIEGRPVDGRADLYALGCVLYEALTGSKPFAKESDVATLWAQMNDPPPRATEALPDLPAALDDVIEKALAKAPDDRYATCQELVDAARAALQPPQAARTRPSPTEAKPAAEPTVVEEAVPVPEQPAPQPPLEPAARRPIPRKALVLGGLGVAGVAGVAVALALVLSSSGSKKTRPPAPSPKLAARELATNPNPPIAGRRFAVAMTVVVAGSGRPIATGKAACKATLDGRPLATSNRPSFSRRGRAACQWRLPGTAAGSTLAASISVTHGRTVTKRFHERVSRPPERVVFVGTPSFTKPRAGSRFEATFRLHLADDLGHVKRLDSKTTTASCQVRTAGSAYRSARATIASRSVSCAWQVPHDAGGKRLTLLLVVRSDGVTGRAGLRGLKIRSAPTPQKSSPAPSSPSTPSPTTSTPTTSTPTPTVTSPIPGP